MFYSAISFYFQNDLCIQYDELSNTVSNDVVQPNQPEMIDSSNQVFNILDERDGRDDIFYEPIQSSILNNIKQKNINNHITMPNDYGDYYYTDTNSSY